MFSSFPFVLVFCCSTLTNAAKPSIKIEILEKAEKCEFKSRKGDTLMWKYRGTQLDGEEFSTGTYTAVLGKNNMVPGIDQGMYDMCVGESRRIEIPPELGYKTQEGKNIYFFNELMELSRDGKLLASKLGQLKVEVVEKKEKCDYRSKEGDMIYWHYKGTLENGKVFDEGDYSAALGAGTIIKGVNDGMYEMCVGETRKLIVPPHLAYGDSGTGGIPGGATLTFINKLTKIEKAGTKKEL